MGDLLLLFLFLFCVFHCFLCDSVVSLLPMAPSAVRARIDRQRGGRRLSRVRVPPRRLLRPRARGASEAPSMPDRASAMTDLAHSLPTAAFARASHLRSDCSTR